MADKDRDDPKLSTYGGAAAGFGSIKSTFGYMVPRMGLGRSVGAMFKVNQTSGFDCPGCAWPEEKKRGMLEFCENGARAVADEAQRKQVDPAFFAAHSVAELSEQTDRWLNQQGRLSHPMLLDEGASHYTPISWDDAFALIADELRGLDSPDEAIFYTSGRTSNEAAFLYQLFVRQFGTNNLPDCSNMCHESSGRGLGTTIGVGKGTVQLSDFEQADLIFVIGQNPGTNHPRMLTVLEEAAERGAKIVAINPLKEPGLVKFKHPQKVFGMLGRGSDIASDYLRVRIGGDVALLKGLAKAVLALDEASQGKVLDRAFIDAHSSGFDAFAADIRATPWDEITRESGIERAELERIGALYAESERVIACWAMGLTQHKHGVANVQSVVNLLLLRGNLGRPGAGACPVRGHSNVQGDRTMGIWERPHAALLDALQKEFAFEPPRHHGVDAVQAIVAMHEKKARVFFAMGGNFYSATPDSNYTAQALRHCSLTVQVSTKLNRSHLVTGKRALILPCLGRTERDLQEGGLQFVSVEDSMGIVHASRGHLPPGSPELLSEPAIVARLATATLGTDSSVPWLELVADYDRIRDRIARVIPGHEDYNSRVREPAGFVLYNAAANRRFNTSDGKAQFTVHPIEVPEVGDGQLLLMTMRSHDQYNTTIYTHNDRYRGVTAGRKVIFMHPEDAADRGLESGDRVHITSHFRGQTRRVENFSVIPYDLPRGCAGAYFPEANPLVPVDSVADLSNTPTSKAVVITVDQA